MNHRVCCKKCTSSFGTFFNLKKHVKKFHYDDEDYLKSLSKRENLKFTFSCHLCQKNFNHKKNLNFHIKKHHPLHHNQKSEISRTENNTNICAMCQSKCINRKDVLQHYVEVHDIVLKEQLLQFPTIDDFYIWKKDFESDTNSRFIRESSKSLKTHKYLQFICHRSGHYVPEGKGIRRLKSQGSSKINAVCPASINIKERFDDKTCDVKIQETHVGHQIELEHLQLTQDERQNLATKISAEIPFDEILDEVRESICDNNVKRIHLITKKDLHNIEFHYNLSSKSMTHSKKEIKKELQKLMDSVDAMTSQSELDVIKNCIAQMNSTLTSLKSAT